MDPVSSLIGAVLIGFGSIILYGAVKNKRVFGQDGIIPQALAKGSVTNLSGVPEAFPRMGGRVENPTEARQGSRTSKVREIQDATDAIGLVDKALAKEIEVRAFLATADSTRAELTPLAQLLAVADGKGLTTSTAIIRAYILELTGESI